MTDDPSDPAHAHAECDDEDLDDEPDPEPSRDELRRRKVLADLRDLCPELAALEVARVDVPFSGYYDDGTVEEPVAYCDLHEDAESVPLPRGFGDRLVAAVEVLLPWGWENNNETYGKFVLDVAARKVRREQTWLCEETEEDEETLPA